MGEIEFGKCDVCGKDAPLWRKYYRYDIQCECHSPQHFDLVRYCKDCTPKPPKTTKITLKVESIKDIRREKLIIIDEKI